MGLTVKKLISDIRTRLAQEILVESGNANAAAKAPSSIFLDEDKAEFSKIKKELIKLGYAGEEILAKNEEQLEEMELFGDRIVTKEEYEKIQEEENKEKENTQEPDKEEAQQQELNSFNKMLKEEEDSQNADNSTSDPMASSAGNASKPSSPKTSSNTANSSEKTTVSDDSEAKEDDTVSETAEGEDSSDTASVPLPVAEPALQTTKQTEQQDTSDSDKQKSADGKNGNDNLTKDDINKYKDKDKLIQDMYKDSDVQKAIDLDGDGKVSDTEKAKFEGSIKNGKKELELDDIKKTLSDIKDNKFDNKQCSQYLLKDEIQKYSSKSRLMKDMYDDPDVIKAVDTDGDGKLSDEERAKFESYIKGDKDKLELEDIKNTLNDIKDNKFDSKSYEKFKPDDKTKKSDTDTSKTDAASSAKGSSGASGASGSGGGGGGSSSSGVTRDPNDINQMTLEELKAEQAKRQETADKAEQQLKDVYSGNNSAVEAADKELETAEEEYQKALDGESPEVKEMIQGYEKNRSETLESIEQNQTTMDELNSNLLDYESQKSQLENDIATCDANISALQSALESYPDNADGDKQAEIDQSKAEIEAQIAELEAQKASLEEQKNEAETNITNTNQLISDTQTLINDLNAQYDEISAEMENLVSESTKEALQKVREAKDNIQIVRKQQAEEIKSKTVEPAKKDLDEINAKVREKEAAKLKSDNSFGSSDKAIEVLEALKGASIAQLRELYNKAGVDFHYEEGYCAETAYYALIQAYGGKENLPEWLKSEEDGGSLHYQSALGFYSAGLHNNKIVEIDQAQAGDVLIADNDHFFVDAYHVPDHVMMVKEVLPNGNIVVIEGNGPQAGVAERVIGYNSDPNRYKIVSTHI